MLLLIVKGDLFETNSREELQLSQLEDLTGKEDSFSSEVVKELVCLEFSKLLMDFLLEKFEILTVAGIST